MPTYLTSDDIDRCYEVTKNDLYNLLSELGRKKFSEIFDSYNPNEDDEAPSYLIELLFGDVFEDENYTEHSVASDLIIKAWKKNNKLAQWIEPKEQKLQTKWIKTRRAVFERDGYKCAECGTNKNLCAHHIKPRSEYPNLIYDMENIITLCKSCHAKKHPNHSSLILSKAVDNAA